jgi:hypothetical protein
MPVDSIDLIMKQYRIVADNSLNAEGLSVIHNLPTRISCSIREYLCYKAYLVMYYSEEFVLLSSDMVFNIQLLSCFMKPYYKWCLFFFVCVHVCSLPPLIWVKFNTSSSFEFIQCCQFY